MGIRLPAPPFGGAGDDLFRTWSIYRPDAWFTIWTHAGANSDTSASPSALDRPSIVPFAPAWTASIDALGAWVNNFGAGDVRLGLYTSDTTVAGSPPLTKVVEAVLDTPSNNAFAQVSITPYQLQRGQLYWLMFCMDISGSSPTFNVVEKPTPLIQLGRTPTGTGSGTVYVAQAGTRTSGQAFPASSPLSSWTTTVESHGDAGSHVPRFAMHTVAV